MIGAAKAALLGAAGNGEPAAFLYYFDENSTTTFNDEVSATAAVLTDSGTVSSSTSGVPSGVTRWVRVGAPGAGKGFDTPAVIDATGDFTIEITVAQDDVSAQGTGLFVSDGTDSDDGTAEYIGVFTAAGNLRFRINGTNYETGASGASDATAYSLCLMRSGDVVYGFVDGSLIISKDISGLGLTIGSACFASATRRYPGDPASSGNFNITNFRGFNAAVYDTAGYTAPSLPLTLAI